MASAAGPVDCTRFWLVWEPMEAVAGHVYDFFLMIWDTLDFSYQPSPLLPRNGPGGGWGEGCCIRSMWLNGLCRSPGSGMGFGSIILRQHIISAFLNQGFRHATAIGCTYKKKMHTYVVLHVQKQCFSRLFDSVHQRIIH